MKIWTHRYHYTLALPRSDRHGHRTATGTVQASRQLSEAEVEALAKRMAHGTLDNAHLSEVRLTERRSA